MNSPENNSQCLRKGARRLGAVAFLFFLIKGLLWLLAGAGLTLLSRSTE